MGRAAKHVLKISFPTRPMSLLLPDRRSPHIASVLKSLLPSIWQFRCRNYQIAEILAASQKIYVAGTKSLRRLNPGTKLPRCSNPGSFHVAEATDQTKTRT